MIQSRWSKDKNIIQSCGNALYFMLIFTIVFDPTNTILHLKDIFFILLVGFNCIFFKPNFSYLPYVLIIYGVNILCYVLGNMQGCMFNYDTLSVILKAFAPLILLLWTPYYNVIKLSKIPITIVAIIICFLFVAVCSSEVIELFVYKYVKNHNDMIMMTTRNFFGFKFFGMYYKSIVSFVFVLFVYYYQLYHGHRHRIRTFIITIFLTIAFLVSGTRASMLLPFAMIGLVMYRTILNMKKAKYFCYPILALFAIAFIGVVLLLASEKGEASNAIKYGHLVSYASLFEAHPEYMLLGQGPGAIFYSEGFNGWVAVTEWTYLEFLRNYGIFSIGILGVLLVPIFALNKHRDNEVAFGVMGAYILFLLIAGTNPLLVSSTGILVLLSVFSFVHQLEKNPKLTAI